MMACSRSTMAASVAFDSFLGRHPPPPPPPKSTSNNDVDDDNPCSLLSNIRRKSPALYTSALPAGPPIWAHSPPSPSHNYLHNAFRYSCDLEKMNDEDDVADFFDTRESMSVASSSDVDDDLPFPLSSSNNTHYHDAAPDFFSDDFVSNSSTSFSINIQKELKSLRSIYIEEVERRKKMEKDLLYIRMHWQRMAACLSLVGLTFAEIQQSGDVQHDLDSAAICQEIIVTKFISEAIYMALARAESEIIIEEIIDSKNKEISRLRDRLQYYEAVNHEMSQRNQEAVEFSRQQCLRRKTKWRFIWGCVGLSITFGASLLAYSYVPCNAKDTLPTSICAALDPSTLISVETEGY